MTRNDTEIDGNSTGVNTKAKNSFNNSLTRTFATSKQNARMILTTDEENSNGQGFDSEILHSSFFNKPIQVN